ncbi:MAG: hypothetical protein QXO00_04115 [Candidatus Bathyarchaeia archaeon]
MEKSAKVTFQMINGRIPKRKIENRGSIYDELILALISNPRKVFLVNGGSASGLKNAIRRRNGGDASKFVVAERKGKLYAMFKGD